MSVIIKGMDKPWNCGRCDLSRHGYDGDTGSCPLVGTIMDYNTIDPDCPLMSVDELFDELKERIEE